MNKKILAVLSAAVLAGGVMMGMTAQAEDLTPWTVPQTSHEIQFYGAKDLKELPASEVHAFRGNPFGLVYKGAITKNEPGKVNIHPVTYNLNGNQIAANVYTPANYDPAKKYAAIVVAHPNGGVKEQVAGLYAQRLAEAGFITLAADASFQGASGGEPRNLDNPAFRVEDIHGMLDIIASVPGVDPNRVGALGICGGGGYTIKATQTDKRAKAVATISMFNSGIVRKNGYMNSEPEKAISKLHAASDQRAKEAAGGDIARTPGMESMDLTADQMKGWTDLYREGYEYYGKTHRHPNSTFMYTIRSNMDLFSFDAAYGMELIDQPLLMIAGSKADSLYMTEDAFSRATGTKDKELFLVDGATHIQTYWKPEYVDQIANKLVQFYSAHLK